MYTARGSPRLAVGLQGPKCGPGDSDVGSVWVSLTCIQYAPTLLTIW